MIEINTLHSKLNDSLYDLDFLKQKQVQGGMFSNSFSSNKNLSRASFTNFSDKFSLSMNGEEITDLACKYTIVNSKKSSGSQVITSPGSQVIINGKEY